MARLLFAAAVTTAAACSADTATKEADSRTPVQSYVDPHVPIPTVVPENAADRGVRRHLNAAIAEDPDLKDREISFIVSNGDVSVTGTVRSEAERKKINDIALGIEGVKSVANALRLSP